MPDISTASSVKLGNLSATEMWFGGAKIWPTKNYWPGLSFFTDNGYTGLDTQYSNHSVAMNSSGDIVAVGIDLPEEGGTNTKRGGYVRVWKFSNGSWSPVGSESESVSNPNGYLLGELGDRFGYSLSINSDATASRIVLAVGAPEYGWTTNQSGMVTVFFYDGSNWTVRDGLENTMYLYGPGYKNVDLTFKGSVSSRQFGDYNAYFGKSVQLSGDGNTLVVGTPNAQNKLKGVSSSEKGWIQYSSSGAEYEAEDKLIIYGAYTALKSATGGVRCYCSSFNGGGMTTHSSGVNNKLYTNREYVIQVLKKLNRDDAVIKLVALRNSSGVDKVWWGTPVTDLELIVAPNPTVYTDSGSEISGVSLSGGRTEVFKYDGTQWKNNGVIEAQNVRSLQGAHVAINSAGTRIATTKPYARSSIYPTENGTQTGGCCVYDYINGSWTLTGDIEGSGNLFTDNWSVYEQSALSGYRGNLISLEYLRHGGGGLAMNGTGSLIFIYNQRALQIIKKVAEGGSFYGLVSGNWESKVLFAGSSSTPAGFPSYGSTYDYQTNVNKNSRVAVNQSGDTFVLDAQGGLSSDRAGYLYVYNYVNNGWALKGARMKLRTGPTGSADAGGAAAINSTGTRVVTTQMSVYQSSPRSTLNIFDYSP